MVLRRNDDLLTAVTVFYEYGPWGEVRSWHVRQFYLDVTFLSFLNLSCDFIPLIIRKVNK